MDKKPLGVYIHVPFCLKKCNYCDFTSYAGREKYLPAYFDALCDEISQSDQIVDSNKYYVDTIFFGGGTPSLAEPAQIASAIKAVNSVFEVKPDCEITLEANPETVTVQKFKELRSIGINRVSMGAQSFDDQCLKALGRVHTAERTRQAFDILRDTGFEINLDLMFGLPVQDFDIWKASLDEALALRPEHLSFYSLQIEEGTRFYIDYRFGMLQIPSWEENRRMYHYAVDAVKRAGMHHYEISNAALPGKECRHNLKYWQMQDYIGFGTSAHSFIGGQRFFNRSGLSDYRNTEPLEVEKTDEMKGDFIFTQLRLIDGFELKRFEDFFGESFQDSYGSVLQELVADDLLEIKDGICRFTAKGLDQTNPVLERLLNCD